VAAKEHPRDVIEVQLDLAGYPLTVADTAGLRGARMKSSPRRQTGQGPARPRRYQILMPTRFTINPIVPEVAACRRRCAVRDKQVRPPGSSAGPSCRPPLRDSARTGAGLDGLLAALTEPSWSGRGS